MKTKLAAIALCSITLTAQGGLITAIPGPDDQGGMIMPMVSINANDNVNPTSGVIAINFNPASTPQLLPLETLSPGSWFAEDAAWRTDIGSPAGVGGTPVANAGNGGSFNSQYGFTFMANPMMGMANIPTGKSLAIRLVSISSPDLLSFNHVNADNRWDPIFTTIDSQVLWNGSMWHNFFVIPATASETVYSATFEIFIANEVFTEGTGHADYTASALAATMDTNFTPATVEYTWTAIPVPEPSTYALLTGVLVLALAIGQRRKGAGK